MYYIPVVSSYNDGKCLQLTKVSSLMIVLYLALAETSLIKDLVVMVTTESIWMYMICQTL